MTEKRFIIDDCGTLIDMQTRNTYDYVSEVVELLNGLAEENKILQEFKDKAFSSIDKIIQNETRIAENIESTIEGDYVKAVNRLTITAFENLKKELNDD